jgi:hypothetical protein
VAVVVQLIKEELLVLVVLVAALLGQIQVAPHHPPVR